MEPVIVLGVKTPEVDTFGVDGDYTLITDDADSTNLLALINTLHPEFNNNITGVIGTDEMIDPVDLSQINYIPLTATHNNGRYNDCRRS